MANERKERQIGLSWHAVFNIPRSDRTLALPPKAVPGGDLSGLQLKDLILTAVSHSGEGMPLLGVDENVGLCADLYSCMVTGKYVKTPPEVSGYMPYDKSCKCFHKDMYHCVKS